LVGAGAFIQKALKLGMGSVFTGFDKRWRRLREFGGEDL
jgi:hypothetical protein